ncbi:MAG TPA: hypothetical protein VKB24_09155, partial [Candidatus Acidoferrum sp.]|nr:hypothetical protein [Candidatus Acidoferrum sp.]
MFSDHDNPVTAAAAAPADEALSAAAPENPNQQQAVHGTPSQRTVEDPLTPETPVAAAPGSDEAHARAEANAAQSASDAEAAAAAEEAAGSEEMSKLLEQYDEQHEAQAQIEIIEVKVIAYTEHGVVVDLGQKTEGLIPAVEFTETEIPRPDPN